MENELITIEDIRSVLNMTMRISLPFSAIRSNGGLAGSFDLVSIDMDTGQMVLSSEDRHTDSSFEPHETLHFIATMKSGSRISFKSAVERFANGWIGIGIPSCVIYDDVRDHPRTKIKKSTPSAFEIMNDNGHVIKSGTIGDISPSGIGVNLPLSIPMEKEDYYSWCRITIEPLISGFNASAKVVRVVDFGKIRRAGLIFVDMPEEDIRFLADKIIAIDQLQKKGSPHAINH